MKIEEIPGQSEERKESLLPTGLCLLGAGASCFVGMVLLLLYPIIMLDGPVRGFFFIAPIPFVLSLIFSFYAFYASWKQSTITKETVSEGNFVLLFLHVVVAAICIVCLIALIYLFIDCVFC
jgi:hypothetical protein